MELIVRAVDKAGALGSVISAMGCAICFPTIASLDTIIGLGFLQECGGLFIFTLLPLFAVVALLTNALGWLSYRQWHRSLLSMIEPVIVLARIIQLLGNWQITRLVYIGLALMIGVSTWDLVLSTNRRYGPDDCEPPTGHG